MFRNIYIHKIDTNITKFLLSVSHGIFAVTDQGRDRLIIEPLILPTTNAGELDED